MVCMVIPQLTLVIILVGTGHMGMSNLPRMIAHVCHTVNNRRGPAWMGGSTLADYDMNGPPVFQLCAI